MTCMLPYSDEALPWIFQHFACKHVLHHQNGDHVSCSVNVLHCNQTSRSHTGLAATQDVQKCALCSDVSSGLALHVESGCCTYCTCGTLSCLPMVAQRTRTLKKNLHLQAGMDTCRMVVMMRPISRDVCRWKEEMSLSFQTRSLYYRLTSEERELVHHDSTVI